MRGHLIFASVLALGVAGCAPVPAADNDAAAVERVALPADLLTAPGRPDPIVAQDAIRHPIEVLTFFGVQPGDTAADIMAGSGYYTELLARAVGPNGMVIATLPASLPEERRAPINAVAERNANVELRYGMLDSLDFAPGSVDLILFSMIYHDIYHEQADGRRIDPAAYTAALYRAVAPGGVVGVIDHAASAGADPQESADALHRIDPAVVRRDFEAAGFVFDGEIDVLANPEDDHTLTVFDPQIRRRTDQFVYRFVKPAG